jgi:hypothetical protein
MRALMILTLAAILGLATAAQAQRVGIRTGEHDGFTRLVLTLPEAGAWRVTRTDDGYAVAIGNGRPDYDLSDVFRLIPRTRLADIRTDPVDGRLRLDIGCQCHAWAIELRRGLLVIDLRDGVAPPASPYEVNDQGKVMAALQAPGTRPWPTEVIRKPDAPSPYHDWKAEVIGRASGKRPPAASQGADPPPPTGGDGPSAAPPQTRDWREALIAELGRGATRGVVELAPVLQPPSSAGMPVTPSPQVRIGDGPLPSGTAANPDPGVMTAAGHMCIPDEELDLSAWGDPAPVAQVIGPLTRKVMGEFDRLDPAAAERAIRYMLHVGFGAEARQMLDLAGPDLPQAATLRALSYLLDGGVPPNGDHALVGMTGCDTSAALWSLLSLPPGTAPRQLRDDAVLRAFSALPLHLRRYLGPAVAGRLLSAGKAESARAVRDAILRAPGDPGAAVTLMSIGIDEAAGKPPRMQDLAQLRATPGETGLRATILSLETDIAAGRPSAPALLTTAEALLREYRGTAEAAALASSLAPAQALAGDIPRALDLAGADDVAGAAVWAVLAKWGSDGAVLTHGLRRATDLPQGTPVDTDRAMARRLLALGFPREAMAWIDPARRRNGQQETADLLLMAEAFLADRDARRAMAVLGGIDLPEAQALRSRALLALNSTTDINTIEDQATIARRTGRWDVVAALGEGAWRDSAALVPAPAGAGDGPLAQGRALREESATARARLTGLLEASRLPEQP